MASRKEKELAYLKKLFENHKGDWLDWDGVEKYRCLAKNLLVMIHSLLAKDVSCVTR